MAPSKPRKTDKPVSTAAQWKRSGGNEPIKLELPSGNVCLARNPGMEMFLTQGLIPNALLPLVQQAVQQGEGLKPEQTAELGSSPEMLSQVIEFANAALVHCVVEPVVSPVPEFGMMRDPDLLYADDVALEDKVFIMQWVVGGTSDLERFRQEQAAAMAPVPTVEAVEHKTE